MLIWERTRKDFYLLRLIRNLFCVLRTDYKTPTAHYTLLTYDIGLVAGKSNGFNGAVADTFVAVFTV